MKTISMRKLVFAILCSGLLVSAAIEGKVAVSAESLDTFPEGEVEQEQNDLEIYRIGTVDYIGEEWITVNDQGLGITQGTHYRTSGGGVTDKDHFSIGDTVQYIVDPEGRELIELRLKERHVVKEPEQKNSGKGTIQLKDGVWTN